VQESVSMRVSAFTVVAVTFGSEKRIARGVIAAATINSSVKMTVMMYFLLLPFFFIFIHKFTPMYFVAYVRRIFI